MQSLLTRSTSIGFSSMWDTLTAPVLVSQTLETFIPSPALVPRTLDPLVSGWRVGQLATGAH